jgi:ABC transporter DrrB family efflux protein
MFTTLLRPDGGSASVAGFDVVTQAHQVRSVISLTGQYTAVDEDLTGFENLVMIGVLSRLPIRRARARAAELFERFGLEAASDRLVRTYSGGMRRRLDLGASLVVPPVVLFLDEPTTRLDPPSRLELWDVVRDLRRDGTTILLTTQYLEEADQLADRISVINSGRIIAEGSPDELKALVGGDVLVVSLAEPRSAPHACKVLSEAFDLRGPRAPAYDETGQVTVSLGPLTLSPFAAMRTGVAVADDLDTGMIDRFRSLPIARSAVLVGRTVSDTMRLALQTVLLVLIALAIGFRFDEGFVQACGVVVTVVAFALAFTALAGWVGLCVGDPETAQTALLVPVLALVFASSAFSPVNRLPGFMQPVATWNPVTSAVDLSRSLAIGGPLLVPFVHLALWVTAITVLFTYLGVRRYRRATSGE